MNNTTQEASMPFGSILTTAFGAPMKPYDHRNVLGIYWRSSISKEKPIGICPIHRDSRTEDRVCPCSREYCTKPLHPSHYLNLVKYDLPLIYEFLDVTLFLFIVVQISPRDYSSDGHKAVQQPPPTVRCQLPCTEPCSLQRLLS